MFVIEKTLQFINVDLNYLKKLHETCPEVYYKPVGYENKPFLGILVNKSGRKYVLPLSSAKEKHKTWKDVDKDRFVIFDYEPKENLNSKAIFVETGDLKKVKHIHSVLDLKKMIPVKDGVYSIVNLNSSKTDTPDIAKYKKLLNKEYWFCVKIIDTVLEKVNKLYDRQMRTGKVVPFCCDFKLLEKVCDAYSV